MEWLVLFDIDGTLVRGGPAKEAFEEAMVATYGTVGAVGRVAFSGKTDRQIARELLQHEGLPDGVIEEGFPELWRRYLSALTGRLPDRPMEILPGVRDLVDALLGDHRVDLALVTGNILDGARLKLRSAGLNLDFPLDGEVVGGFGSDAEDRNELPGFALRRAASVWGRRYVSHRVVVVGDTPRDVACGRFVGARTVAVATGNFSVAELRGAGADAVLGDFGNLGRSVDAILAAAGSGTSHQR